jgi:hypothetical protein
VIYYIINRICGFSLRGKSRSFQRPADTFTIVEPGTRAGYINPFPTCRPSCHCDVGLRAIVVVGLRAAVVIGLRVVVVISLRAAVVIGLRAIVFLQVLETSTCRGGAAKILRGY